MDLNPDNADARYRDARIALAEWFESQQRALPWRTERSLYRTVVSEIMAQQTQIETMLPYFERWMQRFPDFDALAQASEDEVLKLWEGLGYYSRARNLLRLAREWCQRETPPANAKELRELPGIGPYTSAAIASLHFDEPVAVVDGNVVRVLARLDAIDREFASSAEAVKSIQPRADRFLDASHPGRHNEAVMELGALVCIKQKPACLICPLQRYCLAHEHGLTGGIPKIRRKAQVQVERRRAVCIHEGAVLLARAGSGSRRLGQLFEFPEVPDNAALPSDSSPLFVGTRGIANERIRESFYAIDAGILMAQEGADHAETRWVPIEELHDLAMSGPHRRWLPEILRAIEA